MSDQKERASTTGSGADAVSEVTTAPAGPVRRYGRRALMLGAAAGGAGVAASVAGGGLASAAPDSGPVVKLGTSNKTAKTTEISSSSGTGLFGRTAKKGQAGLTGFDDTTSKADHGFGVWGHSNFGAGVFGSSSHFCGVIGNNNSAGQSGVRGLDFSSSAAANGVYGQSNDGDGVLGFSYHGNGVSGHSSTSGKAALKGVDVGKKGGMGLFAQSVHGTAAWVTSGEGVALKVTGKTEFSNSGLAHVASGSKTVTVKVAGLTPSSVVLATIQKPQGTVCVAGAEAGSGQFTITLTGKATSSLPVGWFVIG